MNSFPVRYMVVNGWFWMKIIDTSFEGEGRTIGRFLDFGWAHHVAALLNENEGYRYETGS